MVNFFEIILRLTYLKSQNGVVHVYNEALSSGEPKPIISNVARGPKARGQHWKLLAEGHHLINSL